MKRATIYHLIVTLFIFFNFRCTTAFLLNLDKPIIEELSSKNLIKPNQQTKLHLGCGEAHFKKYINIDFPSSEHTVQTTSGADIFADIRYLNFPDESVDKIRLHHVFEHFDRPTAIALLCNWYSWLKVGGTLIIETPDFERCIHEYLSPKHSYEEKQVILRHLFGSHEASWAIHCDGWYKYKFQNTLSSLGFDNIQFNYYSWNKSLINNITVTAIKTHSMPKEKLLCNAQQVLKTSMVNQSDTERLIFKTWHNKFLEFISK